MINVMKKLLVAAAEKKQRIRLPQTKCKLFRFHQCNRVYGFVILRVLEGLPGTYFHKRLHIKVLKSESLVLIARFSRFAPPFLAMAKKEFIRS
jgi:hypothetical protein